MSGGRCAGRKMLPEAVSTFFQVLSTGQVERGDGKERMKEGMKERGSDERNRGFHFKQFSLSSSLKLTGYLNMQIMWVVSVFRS